jgi:hypothetical protein
VTFKHILPQVCREFTATLHHDFTACYHGVAKFRAYGSKGGETTGVLDQGVREVGDRRTAFAGEDGRQPWLRVLSTSARKPVGHTVLRFPVWHDRRTRPTNRTTARLLVWRDPTIFRRTR